MFRMPSQSLQCPGCGAEITLAGSEDATVRVMQLRDGRSWVVAERRPEQPPDADPTDQPLHLSMRIEWEGRSLHTCTPSTEGAIDERYDLLLHHEAQVRSRLERVDAADTRQREQVARMLRDVTDQIAALEGQ